ncbi:hypothetical protein D3C75_1070360 [compost metagenome]
MDDIAANGIETEEEIKLLIGAGALKRQNKRNAVHLFGWRYDRRWLLWRPDLLTVPALHPLRSPWVMPIANRPLLPAIRAKVPGQVGFVR